MEALDITREDMWAKQALHEQEIDYSVWNRDKAMLQQMGKMNHSCTFVVDVCKCRYTYASSNFVDLLGYDNRKIEMIEEYDDNYLESRIHPEDLFNIKSLQISLSQFIYSQPIEDRNNYKNIFSYRVLNAKGQYINVTSKQQVLETSDSGKAWLILGVMDIASDQRPLDGVQCTVLNLKTGEMFSPHSFAETKPELTSREIEILQLIKQGLLSKEIACKLGVSIHTVNIHRQNLLRKLGVQNSIEAINAGRKTGLIV
ncbi:LuxR C-terminal-related transcriptional regulator [Bacteroides sp.]|uniref:LuxR C-terminal-related transcriptional regulator n=1 Tax=Bacteroides sp. TaxID=29523 RepID=UPI00262B4B67|nr:LuxR C-terminal-related transcriptional regulator [Bacteroides sp.]MDD3039253.1 LuxR C-terminal-related transcriptional regulator [Bacteroides sp.]